MEKLRTKYSNLLKAFKQLEIIQQRYLNPPAYADNYDLESYITTLVKRFEFSYELLWKILKLYFTEEGLSISGSKQAILFAQQSSIIDDHETMMLMQMVDSRNESAHDYNSDSARRLCNKIIKEYYPVLASVIKKIEKLTDK